MLRKPISFSWKVQVSADTVEKLQKIAESVGGAVSPNAVAAMFVYEAAQVPPEKIWIALGALRHVAEKGEAPSLQMQIPEKGTLKLSR